MKNIKIILLLVFGITIQATIGASMWKAQPEDTQKRLAGSYIDDPVKLTKLFGILSRTAKLMEDSKEAGENYFNKKKKLPYVFTNFKFDILPQNVNLPPILGKKVKNVNILAGFTDPDARGMIDDGRDEFLDPDYFLATFDPVNNKNIIFDLTFDDNTNAVLTLQTAEDNQILREILKDHPFFEDAFVAIERALPEKDWIELENYDWGQVGGDNFYLNNLHPKIIADVQKFLDQHKQKDAIVVEIGAGLAKLSKQMLKQLLIKDNAIHIFAAELLPANVKSAKQTAPKDMPKLEKSNSSIDFIVANSISLLDKLEETGALQKIKNLRQQYYLEFGRQLPLIVAASGALTRLVLNDAFQSVRALQNIYRLQPELLIIGGLTEVIVNEHILKNLGFETLYREKQFSNAGHYYKLRAKSVKEVAEMLQGELKKNPQELDLSLNADPVGTLQNIQPKYLEQVTTIDISHAFFRKFELREFLDLVQLRCPNIQSIIFDFHYDDVEKSIKQAAMESKIGSLIKSRLTINERDLAFSKQFIRRIISPAVLKPDSARSGNSEVIQSLLAAGAHYGSSAT